MAPAVTVQTDGHANGFTTNGTTLKATAPSFHPTGTPDPSKYHATSTNEAINSEHTHAAHNYHPLPIVFSRAAGCSVWDPEGKEYVWACQPASLVNAWFSLARYLSKAEAHLASALPDFNQMLGLEESS